MKKTLVFIFLCSIVNNTYCADIIKNSDLVLDPKFKELKVTNQNIINQWLNKLTPGWDINKIDRANMFYKNNVTTLYINNKLNNGFNRCVYKYNYSKGHNLKQYYSNQNRKANSLKINVRPENDNFYLYEKQEKFEVWMEVKLNNEKLKRIYFDLETPNQNAELKQKVRKILGAKKIKILSDAGINLNDFCLLEISKPIGELISSKAYDHFAKKTCEDNKN